MPFSDGRITEHLIDTHTHITPNVDDGEGSMEMSLAMLRSEAEQGAKVVFLTPHSSAFGGTWTAYTLERMQEVQEAAVKEGAARDAAVKEGAARDAAVTNSAAEETAVKERAVTNAAAEEAAAENASAE